MTTVKITVKVNQDIKNKIYELNYPVSDIIQASLNIFLNLEPEEQASLLNNQVKIKNMQRVIQKYGALIKNSNDE